MKKDNKIEDIILYNNLKTRVKNKTVKEKFNKKKSEYEQKKNDPKKRWGIAKNELYGEQDKFPERII